MAKTVKITLISLPAPFASEPAMNPQLGLCYIVSYLNEQQIQDTIQEIDIKKINILK